VTDDAPALPSMLANLSSVPISLFRSIGDFLSDHQVSWWRRPVQPAAPALRRSPRWKYRCAQGRVRWRFARSYRASENS
jgi:hypothetical protein